MSVLEYLNPMFFFCEKCKKSTQKIGVRWACGHVACCSNATLPPGRCQVPFCRETQVLESNFSEVKFDPWAKIEEKSLGSIHISYPKCPLHGGYFRRLIPESSQKIVLDFRSCLACGQRKRIHCHSHSIFSRGQPRWIQGLARRYRQVVQLLDRSGKCLPFQRLLDQRIEAEIEGMFRTPVEDIFEGHHQFFVGNIRKSTLHGVQSFLLNDLEFLLKKLVKNFGRFSEAAILGRLFSTLSPDVATPESIVTFGEAAPNGEGRFRSQMEQFLTQPFPHPVTTVLINLNFWNIRPNSNSGGSLLLRSRGRVRSKALASLDWTRTVQKWRNSVPHSSILRPRDACFLAGLFPSQTALQFIDRIDEERESWDKFRRAVKGREHLMVLIRSGKLRFGVFNFGPWLPASSPFPAFQFLFSLDDRRVYQVDVLRLTKPTRVNPSNDPEPHIARFLTR